jgi:hypothetical protein
MQYAGWNPTNDAYSGAVKPKHADYWHKIFGAAL